MMSIKEILEELPKLSAKSASSSRLGSILKTFQR
jgi:hypothetical protein